MLSFRGPAMNGRPLLEGIHHLRAQFTYRQLGHCIAFKRMSSMLSILMPVRCDVNSWNSTCQELNAE